MRDPGAAAGPHHRLDGGNEAARRDLQRDVAVLVVVDVRLAIGDDEHLRAGQLLLEQGAKRGRRPFDLDAFGIAALDIEFTEKRLDLAIEHRVLAARACRLGAELFDLCLDRALPTAQEALHHGGGEKPETGRHADQGESKVAPGLAGSRIGEGEIVQQHDVSLLVAGGYRKQAYEVAAVSRR